MRVWTPFGVLFSILVGWSVESIGEGVGGAAVEFVPGKVTERIVPGERQMRYFAAVPEMATGVEKGPLLILFSPRGDGRKILEPVAPAGTKYGWVVVGVDRLKNGLIDVRQMTAMEDEVLDDIFEVVPHDPKRIYLGGLSGGAMRAFGLTVRRPEPFAGVLSIGGWLGGRAYASRDYPKGLAVAMVAGDKDVGAHQWSRHDAAVFNRLGGRVQMFVFPGGHEMAPTGILRQAIRWFDRDWRDYR